MTDIKEQISLMIHYQCDGCKWFDTKNESCEAPDEHMDEHCGYGDCWIEK